MQKIIRLIAQCVDVSTGKLIEESVIKEEPVSKALTLKELGYSHVEQIDFLRLIQDFKIKHQILLNTVAICPICSKKTMKHGVNTAPFHAVLTDHEVLIQLTQCKCGWQSPTSIDGIFGSKLHPDLLKKQAIQGCKESFEKSSKSLEAESCAKRSVNGHTQISRSVKLVGAMLEKSRLNIKLPKDSDNCTPELIVNIDGGHIKSRGDNRSFEAMVATVYQPTNVSLVNKSHNEITSKTIVASAKDDAQATMKRLFKVACVSQGMGTKTLVTCLADGADNCRAIANSIIGHCNTMVYILDWFHISMKFKNITIPEQHKELFAKIKWHLWHGNPEKALLRLDQFKKLDMIATDESTLMKLNKLSTYILNNKTGIVNYEVRKNAGLVFTSNLAESMVNTLINERQKGKQKMLWSRDGAHNILQIRAAVRSFDWTNKWKNVEESIYKLAA